MGNLTPQTRSSPLPTSTSVFCVDWKTGILRIHVKKGVDERAHKGYHLGSVPFGYFSCYVYGHLRCDQEHPGGVHLVPEEAQAVKDLFRRYASGTVTPTWPRSRKRQSVWRETPKVSAACRRPEAGRSGERDQHPSRPSAPIPARPPTWSPPRRLGGLAALDRAFRRPQRGLPLHGGARRRRAVHQLPDGQHRHRRPRH